MDKGTSLPRAPSKTQNLNQFFADATKCFNSKRAGTENETGQDEPNGMLVLERLQKVVVDCNGGLEQMKEASGGSLAPMVLVLQWPARKVRLNYGAPSTVSIRVAYWK